MQLFNIDSYKKLLAEAEDCFEKYKEATRKKQMRDNLTKAIAKYEELQEALSPEKFNIPQLKEIARAIHHAVTAKVIGLRLNSFLLQKKGETENFIALYDELEAAFNQYKSLSQNVLEVSYYRNRLKVPSNSGLQKKLAKCAEKISEQYINGAENTPELDSYIRQYWFECALTWLQKSQSNSHNGGTITQRLGLLYILYSLYLLAPDKVQKQTRLQQMENELPLASNEEDVANQFGILRYHFTVLACGGKSAYSHSYLFTRMKELFTRLDKKEKKHFSGLMSDIQKVYNVMTGIPSQNEQEKSDTEVLPIAANWFGLEGTGSIEEWCEFIRRKKTAYQPGHVSRGFEKLVEEYITPDCSIYRFKVFLDIFTKMLELTSDKHHEEVLKQVMDEALPCFNNILKNLPKNDEIMKRCTEMYDVLSHSIASARITCDRGLLNEIYSRLTALQDRCKETSEFKRKAGEEASDSSAKRTKTAESSGIFGLFGATSGSHGNQGTPDSSLQTSI